MRPLTPLLALVGVLLAGLPTGARGLRVQNNTIVDKSGQPVHLRGVDRSGTEFACVQYDGIFDGPTDLGSIGVIKSWGANAVRVPLNEDCWLGINNPFVGGEQYRSAIEKWVNNLTSSGVAVVLDLHWNNAGSSPAKGQQVMADADHGPAFWSSVAARFASNEDVIFDLYNEPHDISWQCWATGCNQGFQVAGMQQLVDAVRGAGANNIVMLGGLAWANDLSQWLQYVPKDPKQQLAASWHSYSFNSCKDQSCWDSQVAPIAKQYPVIIGEMGPPTCTDDGYIGRLLPWADTHGVHYLAWTWNAWKCGGTTGSMVLVSDYNGTPTSFGAAYKAHLQGHQAQ